MATKELTCIRCPLGCTLFVELDEENKIHAITGNRCGRGPVYAREEIVDPRRVVTSTVRVVGSSFPLCAVKTAEGVPKAAMFQVMAEIQALRVQAPVRIGDVLRENLAGTGVALVATQERPVRSTAS